MKLFDSLLSLLAPYDCLGCSSEGALMCHSCRRTLQPAISRCYKCQVATTGFMTCRSCRHGSDLVSVRPLVQYQGIAKDIVWKLKFGRAQSAAHELADMLAPSVRKRFPTASMSTYIVTHVPTATSRVRRRGYDQSCLIARRLASHSALPYLPLLARRGQQKQVGASRAQRSAQLTAGFYPLRIRRVKGAHIILVDDVVTTGATLEAAARVLHSAGARRVDAVVFAQA